MNSYIIFRSPCLILSLTLSRSPEMVMCWFWQERNIYRNKIDLFTSLDQFVFDANCLKSALIKVSNVWTAVSHIKWEIVTFFKSWLFYWVCPDIMNNNPIVTRYKDRAHVQFAEFDRIDWNRMKPKCFSSFGLVLNFLFRRSFYICMEYPDKLGRLTFINALAFRWHVTIFHSDSFYWKVYAENGIQTRTKWFFFFTTEI